MNWHMHFACWTLHIQVMTGEEAKEFTFNPFDLTRIDVIIIDYWQIPAGIFVAVMKHLAAVECMATRGSCIPSNASYPYVHMAWSPQVLP